MKAIVDLFFEICDVKVGKVFFGPPDILDFPRNQSPRIERKLGLGDFSDDNIHSHAVHV